jgi:hypothetical protein
MSQQPNGQPSDPILDDDVQLRAQIGDTAMIVTGDRLLVLAEERQLLDVPLEEVRRIQFDIERRRPATLVIVPEHPSHQPQVLAVHHDFYDQVAGALVLVGRRIAEMP